MKPYVLSNKEFDTDDIAKKQQNNNPENSNNNLQKRPNLVQTDYRLHEPSSHLQANNLKISPLSAYRDGHGTIVKG